VRHGREGQPGRICGENTRWQVSQGAAGEVSEDLLFDRVVAVLAFGLDQLYLQP
jgi:hypothetical protein